MIEAEFVVTFFEQFSSIILGFYCIFIHLAWSPLHFLFSQNLLAHTTSLDFWQIVNFHVINFFTN